MYSTDRTCIIFLSSGKYTSQYFEHAFGSRLSQDIESQLKMSLQDIFIMPRLRQNERDMAIGMTHRSGGPKVTTPREDRLITQSQLRQRFQPATITTRRFNVSSQMIRNRLRSNGRAIHARRPYKGPVLLRRHRHARLRWSRHHLRWRQIGWNNDIFSDESRFNLSLTFLT